MSAWRARLNELRAPPSASAGIYANANSANSANRPATSARPKAIGAIGTNVTGINSANRLDQARTPAEQYAPLDRGSFRDSRPGAPEPDRAAFLLRAAEDAFAALIGPEIGPVMEVGQDDHDAGERVALAAFYASPEAVAAEATFCFPCGQPVPRGDRAWSDARGWCCPACRSQWSTSQ